MPPRKRKDPAQPSLEAVVDEPVKTKTSRKGKLDKPIIEVRALHSCLSGGVRLHS